MFFSGVKHSPQLCWHYETGQFRVLQRQSAAFSPVLTHQLSKSHVDAFVNERALRRVLAVLKVTS